MVVTCWGWGFAQLLGRSTDTTRPEAVVSKRSRNRVRADVYDSYWVTGFSTTADIRQSSQHEISTSSTSEPESVIPNRIVSDILAPRLRLKLPAIHRLDTRSTQEAVRCG